MEEDRIKTLVLVVGQHLRREFAETTGSLTPAMREQLDRLYWRGDGDSEDRITSSGAESSVAHLK
jgi:hypothetical protein